MELDIFTLLQILACLIVLGLGVMIILVDFCGWKGCPKKKD